MAKARSLSSLNRKRFSALLIPTIVLAVLLREFWITPIYSDGELAVMREAAVALARQGDIEAALEKLRALSEVAPKDRAIWGDYLTELVRARRDAEALALFSENREKPLPDYALAELFDAALRRGDIELSRELAEREIAQSPQRAEVAAARQRALLDSGLLPAELPAEEPVADAAAASPEIAADSGSDGKSSASALASKPAQSSSRKSASRHYSRQPAGTNPVQRDQPSPPGFPQSTTFSPSSSPSKAEEETPSLAERARNAVREAEQSSPSERIASAEAALPVLDEYAASLAPDSVELRNTKLDRVRALTLANRYDEAAELFESLGDPVHLPLYGVMNGADLYSRRHEPERAELLLKIAEELQPDSRELLIAQFYNQLDLEKYERASQTLTRLRENSNDDAARRDTEIISAMFEAYENRLGDAQVRLEDLQRLNPGAPDIQLRLAQIYRWRGWPRRSLAAYRSAADSTADQISARAGEVAALNDMHAFKQADEQLLELISIAPNHPEVLRAQQERVDRNRWEYSAQVSVGESTENPVTGGGDMAFEQKLYSPPIAGQFRAFAHHRYDWADFPEGSGSANRLGVGGDYRSPDVDFAVEIGNRSPDGEVGLTADGEWKFNDRFSVFGEIQTDSNQVPLRGWNAGIDGHSATVGVLYRADESHALRASYSRADFSDGNRRNALSAQYEQRLFSSAHHRLSGILQGYYSDNSAGDEVAYFNPENEKALGAALRYDGILWRRYERNWSHYLRLGAGSYTQQDFGSGGIWDAEYGQRWQFSHTLDINYGLLYRSRIYDGDREGYRAVFGGVNWRF